MDTPITVGMLVWWAGGALVLVGVLVVAVIALSIIAKAFHH